MGELTIRRANVGDIGDLATMNKQLIEDEKNENTIDHDALKERMLQWISTEYNAYLFHDRDELIGYGLVHMERKPYYLRQFFIRRPVRRQGYGKKAFEFLLLTLNTTEVDIEVQDGNTSGKAFWKALGFKARTCYMTYRK